MRFGQRVRQLGRLTTAMLCLLVVAAVVLIIGLTLQQRGLQDAANVAQLVSVVLAIPPLLLPLLARMRPTAGAGPDREPSEAEPAGMVVDEAGPLRVTAEVADVEVLARRGDGRLLPIGGHSLQIYVESTNGTVILRGLRPIVVSREPVDATLIPKPTLGIIEPRPFDLLLDVDPPELHPHADGVDFPLSVSPSDPEVLQVTVAVRRDQVTWYLLLDWTLHGQSRSYRIDAGGQPFVTVGAEGLEEIRR